ncbi:MAG: hydroxymethylbilane synthase [Chloroflexi bacterium]|nr:hydroxymethylbilane synthase [Chloroflexota bacterium]
MVKARPIVIGTRGSALALAQANLVAAALSAAHPGRQFTLRIIRTEGDRAPGTPLAQFPQRGVFVRELEIALLAGEVDLAVHSMKDLPTDLSAGLEIVAVPQREDPRDALATPSGLSLEALPAGARLGTSSPRRSAQLSRRRPDVAFVPIRGNVDTRWRKATSGEVTALVAAAAGLHRLGWRQIITQYLAPETCLPAVGQGALALESRADDEAVKGLAARLDDIPSRQAVLAERAFLRGLGGGCQTPIAALAERRDGQLHLQGLVVSTDGSRLIRSDMSAPSSDPEGLGQRLAQRLLDMGASEVLGL